VWLRCKDLVLTSRRGEVDDLVCLGRIRSTKAGRPQAFVITEREEPQLFAALATWCETAAPDDTLVGLTYDGFRRVLATAAAALKLPARLLPHSGRSGFATSLYLAGVPVETIRIRGRWKSLASLARYIDTSAAAAVDAETQLESPCFWRQLEQYVWRQLGGYAAARPVWPSEPLARVERCVLNGQSDGDGLQSADEPVEQHQDPAEDESSGGERSE